MKTSTHTCSHCANLLWIPKRGPWEDLQAMGLSRTGESNAWAFEVNAPRGWTIVESSVSPYHHHIIDDSGKLVACLLSKSAGAVGSFQVRTAENCAQKI